MKNQSIIDVNQLKGINYIRCLNISEVPNNMVVPVLVLSNREDIVVTI